MNKCLTEEEGDLSFMALSKRYFKHMLMRICVVLMHVKICVPMDHRGQHQVFSRITLHLVLSQGLILVELEFTNYLDWLVIEAQASPASASQCTS